MCEGEFKTSWNNHTSSFRNINYEASTDLSKHIWKLKGKNKQYEIAWSVVAKASLYWCGTRRCDLCRKTAFNINASGIWRQFGLHYDVTIEQTKTSGWPLTLTFYLEKFFFKFFSEIFFRNFFSKIFFFRNFFFRIFFSEIFS